MRPLKVLALTLGTFVMAIGSAVGAEGAPLKISICRLFISPRRYQSHPIEISGKVMGGIHGIVIFGKSCPNAGMELLIDNSISKRSDVSPLLSAIYKEFFIDKTKQNIMTTVTGRFHYLGSRRKRSTFELDHVLELKVAEPTR